MGSRYSKGVLDGGGADAVLSLGTKGLLAGAGVAATIALIRQVAEANRQRRERDRRTSGSIDPNTIVLHVRRPEKTAESPCSPSGHAKVKVEPAVTSREVRPTASVRPRELDGRFTEDIGKEKSAGFLSDSLAGAGGILAVGGGAVAGYALISRLAQKLEQRRLRKQIAAAQTEYINLLDNGEKRACAPAFSRIFLFDDGDDIIRSVDGELRKQAGIPTDIYDALTNAGRAAKGMTSGMIAAWILGAGASAYVAKRLLENKFDQDNEEEPSRQTRILFKAGESEFEIQPEQFLATVGILRDCIGDSIEPGVKTASKAPDYSFLDSIASTDRGRQWILDRYAMSKGLQRDSVDKLKMPFSVKMKYAGTLRDIRRNPQKHMPAINGYVMDMMRKDPESWFRLLGSDRNNDIVRLKAQEQIANMDQGQGLMAALAKIPVVGGALKNSMSTYMTSLGGRRALARETLKGMGVHGGYADDIVSKYDYTSGGWAPKATEKAAGDFSDGILAFMARNKTMTDKSNKDVLKAIEELKNGRRRKGKKGDDLVVEFDDELDGLLSEEDKARIIRGLSGK